MDRPIVRTAAVALPPLIPFLPLPRRVRTPPCTWQCGQTKFESSRFACSVLYLICSDAVSCIPRAFGFVRGFPLISSPTVAGSFFFIVVSTDSISDSEVRRARNSRHFASQTCRHRFCISRLLPPCAISRCLSDARGQSRAPLRLLGSLACRSLNPPHLSRLPPDNFAS